MQRYNVVLDDETVDLLAKLSEHYGINDRSGTIRYIVRKVAREELRERKERTNG